MRRTTVSALLAAVLVASGVPALAAEPAGAAERGLVSIRSVRGDGNFVSWRLLGSDGKDVAFNVYRDGVKVNRAPVTTATSYLDAGAPATASYSVRQVSGGVEAAATRSVGTLETSRDVPIQSPGSGYVANDASVGDLDGDGEYEIVL